MRNKISIIKGFLFNNTMFSFIKKFSFHMKYLILSMVLLVCLFSCKKDVESLSASQVSSNNVSHATGSKRIYLNNAGNWIDQNYAYNSGDTFVLKSSISYTYISMSNVHDVVIINEGGVAKMLNGFNLNSCSNITITGTGSSKDTYGIEISGHTPGDVAIDINGKSKNITCKNLYLHDKTYGFWIKQEVANTCDASLYYPNWYMDNISIIKCKIKRMNQEGMYLGSTGQNADRPNSCGLYPYPMRLSNITVKDNIVDSTGRGGIMLSGADKGTNKISNNTITRCGYELNSYQGNGIVIGGNSYATIQNNTIKNTLCDGIWVLGCGTIKVMNNTIDSCGWLNGTYAGNMHGVSFDARPTFPFRLSTFYIENNTISKHTDAADVYIYNTFQNNGGKIVSGFGTSNHVYNNNSGGAKVVVQSGIVYATTP